MAANLAYAKQHNFLALMLIQEMAKRGQFRIIKEGEKHGGYFFHLLVKNTITLEIFIDYDGVAVHNPRTRKTSGFTITQNMLAMKISEELRKAITNCSHD